VTKGIVAPATADIAASTTNNTGFLLIVIRSVIRNISVRRDSENGNDPLESSKTAAYFCSSGNDRAIQSLRVKQANKGYSIILTERVLQ